VRGRSSDLSGVEAVFCVGTRLRSWAHGCSLDLCCVGVSVV
jgi:hypothetical protein